ncbi:MAG: hypothetical protein DWI57_12080 [Chloroflexi bacterium]|nr:MAG: hypothetical protein DWI57_12080 [Chloroflexota bacterium]
MSIAWHQLLGKLLELTLTPVDIQVETEVQITAQPPKADILLLRRKTARWTEAQRNLLPDGIRESRAAHQLLEFKYSESVSEEALAQAVAYEYFYRTARQLSAKDVQVWLISSKTPRRSRLQAWGYAETEWPGVYHSSAVLVDRVGLLVLNQLSPAFYNSFVKIFASRQEEQETAFRRFNQLDNLESQIQTFVRGLRRIVRVEEENPMTITITPEYVMRLGEDIKRIVLEMSTPEELTAHLTPEERLAGLKLEQRLAGLKLEERVAGLAADDLLSHLSFEEIEAYLEEHRPKSEADNGKPA